jgi:hypothetical protein
MDDLSRAQYLPSKQFKDRSTASGRVSAEEDGLMGTDSVVTQVLLQPWTRRAVLGWHS